MNKTVINEIKNIPISKIIAEYISIHKKGRNYFAICPFHNDTNPSLVINDEKNIFKCFTCNTSGDAIKFVSQYLNLPYYKAVGEIANKFEIEFDSNFNDHVGDNYENYCLNQDYLDLCQVYINQPKFEFVKQYLNSRNINDKDIQTFKIGYNPSYKESSIYNILTNENISNIGDKKTYKRDLLIENGLITINQNGEAIDFFQNRIVFAISDENDNIVGFSGRSINNESPKYLNSSQTKIFNKSDILYNYNNFLKNDKQWNIYIVEGFMDVIALHKSGIINSVATMGVVFSDNHINLLKKNKKIESVILAFDNDLAGQEATIKNGLIIAKHYETYVVNHNDNDQKDFDEIFNKYGKEKVNKIANNLVHFSIYYLINLFSNIDNITDFNHKYNEAISFLKKYGKETLINEYINFFSGYNNFLNIENIKKTILSIFENKNIKYEFSGRIKPKISDIKPIDNNLYFENYKYTIERLILACLIDHKNPQIIMDNYLIQMDNILYNVINVLIEFYTQNPDIKQINIDSIKAFKEFAQYHNFKKSIIEKIENKMYDSYQFINKYDFDFNTFMMQIYNSQIYKIIIFINDEKNKNILLPVDSIEKSESTKQINKYIKLKNDLIKKNKSLR